MDRIHPRTHRPRRLLSLLGGVALVGFLAGTLGSPPALGQDPEPPRSETAAENEAAKQAPPPSESADGETPDVAPARGQRALRGIWWNRPQVVAELTLDAEQRAAMDAILRDSMDERRQLQKRLREAQKTFYDKAVSGDRLAAGKALGEMADSAAAVQRFEGQLKLQILARLRGFQRQKLAADFPMLLQRPWIVTRGVRRDFRRTP